MYEKIKSQTVRDRFDKPARFEILNKAYNDLRFFIIYFLQHHVTDKKTGEITPFNKMALDYFDTFNPKEDGVRKIIRAARGSAKTTIIALADTLHRLCFSTDKFIVIFSSTAPLSLDKIKDIKTELINNHELKDFFNIEFDQKRVSTEQFTISTTFGTSTVKAQSFFSQIRGLKKKEDRPTRMIFDDVTHGERVFSEVQREKAKRQYETDIVNAGTPTTSYIFVGTTIHKNDLVTELSQNPLWNSKTYPAIIKWPNDMNKWAEWEKIMLKRDDINSEANADEFYRKNKKIMDAGAKVLWPEREPLLFLMKLRLQGRRSFDAEKQMKPYLSGDSIFSKIHWFSVTERTIKGKVKTGFLNEETGVFIPEDSQRWQLFYALDPATGEKKNQTSKQSLSYSSRLICYRDIETNTKYVYMDKTNRDSPSRIIREMIEWQHKYSFTKVGVEANLYKDLYQPAVKNAILQYQSETGNYINIPFYEIYNKSKKLDRIYSVETKINNGEFVFNKGLSAEAVNELENFPNCDKYDFLDALEICSQLTDPRNRMRAANISIA